MKFAAVVFAVLVLGACGGDSSTGPSAAYPAVAGTYPMSGSFDDVPTEHIGGTLTLTQADRTTGVLGGSINFILTGPTPETISGTLPATVTVSQSGVIDFVFAENGTSWAFNGTLNGKTISGRHVLSGGGTALPGSWSAMRP